MSENKEEVKVEEKQEEKKEEKKEGKVKLISKDNQTFIVSRSVIMQSGLIADMLEGMFYSFGFFLVTLFL